MERVYLLGVPIDPLTKAQALDQLEQMVVSDTQHHVMTPNSEMLAAAHRNAGFKELLNRTDLNLPDSIGLMKMAGTTGQHLPERVTGIDTVSALCTRLPSEQSVYLLGSAEGIAEQAAQKLTELNPHLTIAGTYAGSPRAEDAKAIVERINASGASVLLVAYGAPKQDVWIDQYLKEMPNLRLAMGVGGTFDFLAGTAKRAPTVFQKPGLEWLWRLIREPRRIKRICTAVIVFPLLVLRYGRGGKSD